VQLLNGITLQNLDLYLDTDPAPGAGSTACIPGRRVAFAGGRTWESAVVFTPQPGAARAITQEALGGAADRVIFVDGLQVRGRTVIARVPAALLGGPPRPTWGYSLHLSGAAWERTFALTSRLRGTRQADAFTMPVLTTPEAWAFGGGAMGEAHPRVVDVLLPQGADQKKVLGSYDEAAGAYAQVPFVVAGATPGSAVIAPAVATPTSNPTSTSNPTRLRLRPRPPG
jgi:carbohydrate-binding DOMON domain-containing protein